MTLKEIKKLWSSKGCLWHNRSLHQHKFYMLNHSFYSVHSCFIYFVFSYFTLLSMSKVIILFDLINFSAEISTLGYIHPRDWNFMNQMYPEAEARSLGQNSLPGKIKRNGPNLVRVGNIANYWSSTSLSVSKRKLNNDLGILFYQKNLGQAEVNLFFCASRKNYSA